MPNQVNKVQQSDKLLGYMYEKKKLACSALWTRIEKWTFQKSHTAQCFDLWIFMAEEWMGKDYNVWK